jgi:hypothetical protein
MGSPREFRSVSFTVTDYSARLAWVKDNDKRNLEDRYALEVENPKVACAGGQCTRARPVVPSGSIIVPECLLVIDSAAFPDQNRSHVKTGNRYDD